jgi:hypothetical protein
MSTAKPTFNIGDRVRLKSQKDRDQYTAMTHGIVVYYRGRHAKRNPRVRWASRWGITSKAESLELLPPDDIYASEPPPPLCDIDHKHID